MENQYENEENDGNGDKSLEKTPDSADTNKMPDRENPYPVYTPSPDRSASSAEQQQPKNHEGPNHMPGYNGTESPNQNGYGESYDQGPQQNYYGPNQAGQDNFYPSSNPNTSYYEGPNYQNPGNGYYSPEEPQKGKGMAIASLVLGVLSVISFCCVYLPIFLGITGVVLGLLSKNGNKKLSTEALIGIILSAVGVVISIGMIAVVMFLYKNGIYEELLNMSSSIGIY